MEARVSRMAAVGRSYCGFHSDFCSETLAFHPEVLHSEEGLPIALQGPGQILRCFTLRLALLGSWSVFGGISAPFRHFLTNRFNHKAVSTKCACP